MATQPQFVSAIIASWQFDVDISVDRAVIELTWASQL